MLFFLHMPRSLRIEYPGAFYHVISRGNRQQPVFHQRAGYQRFLDVLYSAVDRYNFHLYAYVLMPNHFHLLLEREDFPLSRFMQVLLTSYARWHNRRYHQTGHVFQGRYRAILCDKESYLLELTRYIHLNPVRAKIVKRPEDYAWSSYQTYLGRAPQGVLETGLVLGMLSRRGVAARRAYEQFVLDTLGEGSRPDFYAATEQVFLGDEHFVEEGRRRYQAATRIESSRLKRPTVQKILEVVSRRTGVTPPVVVGRTEDEAEKMAREIVVGVARDYFGYPLMAVAMALNRKPNTISVLGRKLAERCQREAATQKLMEKILKSIK